MKFDKKIIIIIFLIIAYVIGLATGIIWKDLPFVKFNNEIKIYEVLNILITISIGIFIPFLVKKWIDDGRLVKSFLVDELKNIILTLNKIKVMISDCHACGEITKKQKDEINYVFHFAELQISSLEDQLKISFINQEKRIILKLKENYHKYKDFVTGGELILSSFDKIDDRYYREHNTEYSKVETHLKSVIHQIYKL